jgi:hypothetical protein
MSKEVQAAVGTQRQFAKQPEQPYALQLNKPNFSAGISPRADLDAQRLSNALGLLGDNLMKEKVAYEKRKQDELALLNVDKMLEGKTQEDLQNFDRMANLQNSSEIFDFSHNRYAMAALEKGIGKMASTYAKQEWANDPQSQKPKSIDEAVSLYHNYLSENRKRFSEGIQNDYAFDQGYYEGATNDTLKIANEADKRINDDKRQKMLMLASSEIQDAVYGNLKGEDFGNAVTPALMKMKLAARDITGFAQAITPLAKMIAENDYDTDRLDALGDFEYDNGMKLRQMINLYPNYAKIAENFNYKVTDKIINECTRADGTVDLEKAYGKVYSMPDEISASDGVPEATLPISQGDNPNLEGLSTTMKGALPLIGGAIYQMGFKDAEITSGYRSLEHQMELNPSAPNSYHTTGDAVDIYLGDNVSPEDSAKAKSYFSRYFNEVLYHDAGTGLHLHLAGYKGGLKKATHNQTASAYSPQRKQKIMQMISVRVAQAQAVRKQHLEDERNNVALAVMQTQDVTEQMQIIQNSNLPANEKAQYIKSITRKIKQSANGYGNDKDGKDFWAYEHSFQYHKDWQKLGEYWKALKDPNFDFDSDEGQKLQKEANEASARINNLEAFKQWRLPTASSSQQGQPQQTQQKSTTSATPKASSGSNFNPVNDTAGLSKREAEIARLKMWALGSPTNKQGVPLDEAQIREVIEQAAIEYGYNTEELLEEIFGGRGD